METFSVLILSVLIPWVRCCITVLEDSALGELGLGYTGSPYDFLQLNGYGPIYFKLKCLKGRVSNAR